MARQANNARNQESTLEKLVYECIDALRILTPPKKSVYKNMYALAFDIRYVALHESLTNMRQYARDNNITENVDFLIEATDQQDRCRLYVLMEKGS